MWNVKMGLTVAIFPCINLRYADRYRVSAEMELERGAVATACDDSILLLDLVVCLLHSRRASQMMSVLFP